MCDHIVGISDTKIINKTTKETVALIRNDVLASEVNWKDDGIVNKSWTGHYFKFCPMCGAELAAKYVS